jgi:hypothetical protein
MADRQKQLGSPGGGSSRPPAGVFDRTQERRCSRRVKNAHVPVPLYYCPPVGQPCSSIREAKGRKPTHEEERGWRLRPPGGRARRSSSLAAPARPAGAAACLCFLVSGSDAPVFPSHANRRCVWLESRGSGAERTLVLGTAPTLLIFGCKCWVGVAVTSFFVWLDCWRI